MARSVALLLLGAFVALCAHGLRWDSPTVDEFAHLPAGYYYLKTGNFQLYDLNPPLPRILCALPLLALGPRIDTSARLRDSGWYPWVFGTDFMRRNADRYQEIFLLGRLPVVALGVLLGLLVWRWAVQLHGEAAGLVALAGYAFCPSIIAHAHLATTDLCFALAVTAALFLFHRWLRRPAPATLLAAGVALGLVQLGKFSGVLLYPVLLALTGAAAAARGAAEVRPAGTAAGRGAAAVPPAGTAAARRGAPGKLPAGPAAARRDARGELPAGPAAAPEGPAAVPAAGEAAARCRERRRTWSLAGPLAAGLGGIFLVSLLVLDAGYLFHGVGDRVGDLHLRSRLLGGWLGALPAWLRLPLPRAYLHGFDSIQLINEQGEFPTWFCGRWLAGGTVLYYPLTLLLKTPLPLLTAWFAAPFARTARRPPASRRKIAEGAGDPAGAAGAAGLDSAAGSAGFDSAAGVADFDGAAGSAGFDSSAGVAGFDGAASDIDSAGPDHGAAEASLVPAAQGAGAVREACLWLPALVLLAFFSLGSRVSYGIRYLLPVLPLACIYSARLVPWVLTRGRAVRGAALAALLVYPVSVLAATPDTISYFNLLAGSQPDHYLIDSNLDWGQGLERLRSYLDRERLPGIALAYFGHVDPALYGFRYRLPDPHRPGLAAVSVNFLHGYPYVTDIAGHMVPVPAGAYTWLARYPRQADLGGGLFLYRISGGPPS